MINLMRFQTLIQKTDIILQPRQRLNCNVTAFVHYDWQQGRMVIWLLIHLESQKSCTLYGTHVWVPPHASQN